MKRSGAVGVIETPSHRCHPPATNECGWLPTAVGLPGNVWRCAECRRLWTLDYRCWLCHTRGLIPHFGQHTVGLKWYPAGWLLRFKHRRR